MASPERLILLSWNVFRNYRAAQVAASLASLIETHRPDVLLIQEAPVYDTHRFADMELFAGYNALYAPVHQVRIRSRRLPFESTGQLILSRQAYAATATHDLPALPRWGAKRSARTGTVTRRVLYGRLRLPSGKTVGLYNIHLENRSLAEGRLKQVRHLLEVIRATEDDVVVVGGDFNTFLTPAFEACLRAFAQEGFHNLFSLAGASWRPRLDYILVRGAVAAEGLQLRVRGSDHQPVLATVLV
jgi:endonuclease/exonuclease/phosphatase family metal-dependent hydrolase